MKEETKMVQKKVTFKTSKLFWDKQHSNVSTKGKLHFMADKWKEVNVPKILCNK